MPRVPGYMITAQLFVPVDKSDLNDTVTKAQAILAFKSSGDLTALAQLPGLKTLKARELFTSKIFDASGNAQEDPNETGTDTGTEGETGAGTEGEGGEGEGDQGDGAVDPEPVPAPGKTGRRRAA